ncbi:hypothetical protein FB45DRAFT_1026191 [Roridomyces roridus]|uniref:MYND-type domain-containing protein n=1 Tax=Roridomyces roridus TaxID=1738132 RepID=A0AAD7BZZ3_9AGAR|nr:hypothetical protein FB45DRAFT_1026191 [Roridomyces roridus]
MSVCGKCRSVSYCSVSCQRADWPRHKPRCKQLVAKAVLEGPLSEEFARWRKDMGPRLYHDICYHAMRGHANVEYIESKLILLTLRLREPRGTGNDLQILHFQSIEVLDVADLGTLTDEPRDDLLQDMRDWSRKMKLCAPVPCGAAWLVTDIRSPDGSQRLLLCHQKIALKIEALAQYKLPPTVAEDLVAMVINQGMGVEGPDVTQLPVKQITQYLMHHPEKLDSMMEQTIHLFAQAGDGQFNPASQESA